MGAVLLATLAGASFGCLTVAVQWGIRRGGDPYPGAFVAAAIGAIASAAVAVPSVALEGVRIEELLPFVGAGLVAPGASQILLTLAVRHAGSSRAAILMGAAPLFSIVMAWILLDEVFRPLAIVGTVLIVLGSIALAAERTRPDHFRARGVVLALLWAVAFATLLIGRGEHIGLRIAAAGLLVVAGGMVVGMAR